jgi:hypothetical protein
MGLENLKETIKALTHHKEEGFNNHHEGDIIITTPHPWNWIMLGLLREIIKVTIKDNHHKETVTSVEKQGTGKGNVHKPTLVTKVTTTTRVTIITTRVTTTTTRVTTTTTRAKVNSTIWRKIYRPTHHLTITITWNLQMLREIRKGYSG